MHIFVSQHAGHAVRHGIFSRGHRFSIRMHIFVLPLAGHAVRHGIFSRSYRFSSRSHRFSGRMHIFYRPVLGRTAIGSGRTTYGGVVAEGCM